MTDGPPFRKPNPKRWGTSKKAKSKSFSGTEGVPPTILEKDKFKIVVPPKGRPTPSSPSWSQVSDDMLDPGDCRKCRCTVAFLCESKCPTGMDEIAEVFRKP